MDCESRARGSHYLLLLTTCELPKYRLCDGGRGLDGKRVHEHARRRRHVVKFSRPAGYQFDYEATPSSTLLCARIFPRRLGDGEGWILKRADEESKIASV